MLNLRATYIPKVYHKEIDTDHPGHWGDGQIRTVTIIAVVPNNPEMDPNLLAVTEDGKFISDVMQRFIYTGPGWL